MYRYKRKPDLPIYQSGTKSAYTKEYQRNKLVYFPDICFEIYNKVYYDVEKRHNYLDHMKTYFSKQIGYKNNGRRVEYLFSAQFRKIGATV